MVSNTLLSAGGGVTTWIFVGLLVVLVVVLLVVPMFTNKKRAKQTMDLHNSLLPGDVIKTVGGIIGTIKEIRQISPSDREMIIETGDGDNKTTMTFDIQALYQILERAPRPETNSDVFAHSAEAEVAPEADSAVEKAAEPEHTEEPAPVVAAEQSVEEKAEAVEEKPAEPAAEEAAVTDENTEPAAEEPKAEEAAVAEKPAAKKPAASKAKTSTAKKSTGTSTAQKKTTTAKNSAKK